MLEARVLPGGQFNNGSAIQAMAQTQAPQASSSEMTDATQGPQISGWVRHNGRLVRPAAPDVHHQMKIGDAAGDHGTHADHREPADLHGSLDDPARADRWHRPAHASESQVVGCPESRSAERSGVVALGKRSLVKVVPAPIITPVSMVTPVQM